MNFIVQGYPAFVYTGGRAFDAATPAVVFIHGAAFDHSVWQWQSRYLAHHGRTVLAVDLPAHGRSPGPIRDSIGGFADWVNALLDAAGLAAATVVGHSMGALVALETAIRYGNRVEKLALLGAGVPMAVGEPFIAAARDDSPAAFDMEVVWGHARSAALAQSPVPGMSLTGAARALNGRSRPGVLYADLHACNTYAPAAEAISALAMPTLVIGGTRDQMVPWRGGEALAKRIPGARFERIEAGHSMMSEAPRATLDALRRFLP